MDVALSESSIAAYRRDPASYSHAGGDVGVLLIHGFGGLPGELRSVAEALATQGYSVEVPLLAGHGGTQEALAATSWGDWVDSASAPLPRLRDRCRLVLLVGFSMGGAIGLHLAANGTPCAGLVTISTPIRLDNSLLPLLPLARRAVPYIYPLRRVNLARPGVIERLRTYIPDLDVDPTDAAAVAEFKRTFKVSVEAVYQLVGLLRQASLDLPFVNVPALLIQARDDEQTTRPNMGTIYGRISSLDKQMLLLPDGGHMLPVGPARGRVIEAVLAFAERVGGSPAPLPEGMR